MVMVVLDITIESCSGCSSGGERSDGDCSDSGHVGCSIVVVFVFGFVSSGGERSDADCSGSGRVGRSIVSVFVTVIVMQVVIMEVLVVAVLSIAVGGHGGLWR